MVSSGKVPPSPVRSGTTPDAVTAGGEEGGEADRQLLLRARNASLLCDSFFNAGFTPVVDDVVVRRLQLEHYLEHLHSRPLVLVVLAPRRDVLLARDRAREPHKRGLAEEWLFLEDTLRDDLSHVGLWIDTSDQSPGETVEAILAASGRASVPQIDRIFT